MHTKVPVLGSETVLMGGRSAVSSGESRIYIVHRVYARPRRLCKAADQSLYVAEGVLGVWGMSGCGTAGCDEPHL
jgi:hypothetical protein